MIGDFADDVMDNIIVSDNDIQHAEKYGTIYLTGASERSKGAPFGRLKHVEHYWEGLESAVDALNALFTGANTGKAIVRL